MSLLQNSLRARNFPWFWIAGAGGSDWRWPEAGDAEDLIGGERDDAEHEVAFDLDRAAHAQEPGGEFVLQSSIDAFDHGAEIIEDVICVGHVDELHPVDLPFPFGLDLMLGAKVAVDDRRVAERAAVVMNGGGVVGGTCERRSHPRIRRSDLSTASRSIKAEVVGTPSIALATKALARARRSSGGRPGPRGGSGTKASRPITSRVVTRRPSVSVIGSTSSRSQGNRVPWIWFQRAFMASRGSSDMSVTTTRDDKPKHDRKYPQCTAIYIILW